jgi:hypothetical protein
MIPGYIVACVWAEVCDSAWPYPWTWQWQWQWSRQWQCTIYKCGLLVVMHSAGDASCLIDHDHAWRLWQWPCIIHARNVTVTVTVTRNVTVTVTVTLRLPGYVLFIVLFETLPWWQSCLRLWDSALMTVLFETLPWWQSCLRLCPDDSPVWDSALVTVLFETLPW